MQEVFEKILDDLEKYKYENLIEHDSKIANHCKQDCNDNNDCALCVWDKAIEIVKQASTEYNNGWIPCSVPPKTDNYILLSFENFSVPLVGRYQEDENGGAYYIGYETETCTEHNIFVNAWQPLPDPYNPEIKKETQPNVPEWKEHMMQRFMRGE